MEQDTQTQPRKSPATVVNGTRVTVAFPFSKIALEEPTDELRDLVVLVADLVDEVGGAALRARAEELRARLVA